MKEERKDVVKETNRIEIKVIVEREDEHGTIIGGIEIVIVKVFDDSNLVRFLSDNHGIIKRKSINRGINVKYIHLVRQFDI